jgi:hypothetical protein
MASSDRKRQSAGVEGPCARFIMIGEAVIATFANGTKSRKHSRSPRYIANKAVAKAQVHFRFEGRCVVPA